MKYPPISSKVKLASSSPAEALTEIERYLSQRNWKIQRRDGTELRARSGSRWMLRFWGVFTKIGLQNLPMTLAARVDEPGAVLIELSSDEGGGYLYRMRAAEMAYVAAFSALMRELKQQL